MPGYEQCLDIKKVLYRKNLVVVGNVKMCRNGLLPIVVRDLDPSSDCGKQGIVTSPGEDVDKFGKFR